LEALELVEGVSQVALGGIDDALEAGEGAVAVVEGLTERSGGVECVPDIHFVGPDLGFGDAETAESPSGADQDIDQVALLRDGGAVTLEVLFEEGVEIGGIFAGNDEGLGVDAGFQGIHGGTGLARGGAWARGGAGTGAFGAWWTEFHRMDLPNRKGRAPRRNFSLGEAGLSWFRFPTDFMVAHEDGARESLRP
jgi:hypothetical protein